MGNKSGFTLIELVMIIVVLGILAAVAVPKFFNDSSSARDAVIDGAFGAISSEMQITVAQYKVYPLRTTFQASILNRITRNGWTTTAITYPSANVAAFNVRVGTLAGNRRQAQVGYNDSSFSLSLGATGNW
jgi:MSHA pilin protein MshA